MTTFYVLGAPATKGSTVSFVDADGHVVTKADNKGLSTWTQAVGWAARGAHIELAPRETEVKVTATFEFLRPASQRAPSKRRRTAPTVRPDLDKLTRALLDALTGVAFVDDAQVTRLMVDKVYGAEARTWVCVEALET